MRKRNMPKSKRSPAPQFVRMQEITRVAREKYGMDLGDSALREVLPNVPSSWIKREGKTKPIYLRLDKIEGFLNRANFMAVVPQNHMTLPQAAKKLTAQGFPVTSEVLHYKILAWIEEFKTKPSKRSPVYGLMSDSISKKHPAIIPETTFGALLAWRKNLSTPKQYFTINDFLKHAHARGLVIERGSVNYKLQSMLRLQNLNTQLEGPPPIRIQKNHPRKRIVFDEETKLKLLSWARTLNNLPKFTRIGYATPIVDLAKELKISPKRIHAIPGLEKIRVGARDILDEENAAYARAYLSKHPQDKRALIPPLRKRAALVQKESA